MSVSMAIKGCVRAVRRLALMTLLSAMALACSRQERDDTAAGALLVRCADPVAERTLATVAVTLDGGTPWQQMAQATAVEPGVYVAVFIAVDARPGATHGVSVEGFDGVVPGPMVRGEVGGVQVSAGLTTQLTLLMGGAGGDPGQGIDGVTSSRLWINPSEVAVLGVAASAAETPSSYAWADDCGGSFQILDESGGTVVWAPGPEAVGTCTLGVTAAGPAAGASDASRSGVALSVSVASCPTACDSTKNGAITMGPGSAEGDLRLAPGTVLKAGYDFMIASAHPAAWYAFGNPQVAFSYACDSGSAVGRSIVVPMQPAVQPYSVGADSRAWYPSGDRTSPLAYQGSYKVGQECRGGVVRIQRGVFSASLASTAPDTRVTVRWHHAANGSPGAWSEPQTFSPRCTPLTTSLTVNGFIVSPPQVARLAIQHDTGTCLVDLAGKVSRCPGVFKSGHRYTLDALWYPPVGPAVVVKASAAATCDGPSAAPTTLALDLAGSPQHAVFVWTAPAVPPDLNAGLACRLELTVKFSDGGTRFTTTTIPVAFRVSP